MSANQIFFGAAVLGYVDAIAASRCAGAWEAAAFAALGVLAMGLMIVAAHRIVK